MFCEVAFRGVQFRSIIIPENSIGQWIKRAQDEEVELYRSLYSFDDEIHQHLSIRQSIKGYRGKLFLSKILLDVDKGINSDTDVYQTALSIVDRCILEYKIPEAVIRVAFSGTGYHITFPDVFTFKQPVDIHEVSETIKKYFPTVDNIYNNATRLIRVNGTINNKSRLYKIPLTVREFQERTPDDIRQMAREPRLDVPPVVSGLTLPHLEIPASAPVSELVAPKRSSNVYVTCMHTLYDRGEQRGTRHDDLLRLASVYRRGGLPLSAVVGVLTRWASSLSPYEVQRIVNDVYDNGFEWGCNDRILKQYCDPKCIFYKHKNLKVEYSTSTELEDNFSKYATSERISRSIDFQETLGLKEPFLCEPGEVVVFWGETGIGKTALVQNLVIQATHLRILYITLEVNAMLLYRRNVQIAHGLSKSDVLEHYSTGKNTYAKSLNHIYVTTEARTPSSISRLIRSTQANLVVIDTLDGLESVSKEENVRGGELIREVTNLANDHNIIMFIVHHISKESGKEIQRGERLNLHSGKGASSIEQKADKVIGVEKWPKNIYRTVKSLKSRDENPFEAVCIFDTETFRLIPATCLDEIAAGPSIEGEWITMPAMTAKILPLNSQ
jgi:hypothetical protein